MEIAVSTSPAHIMMTRRKSTWYTVRDGNWNDPNIWISNALDKKNIVCPQIGDDVYIHHNIDYANPLSGGSYADIPITAFNFVIGNLFISRNGILTATQIANQNRLVINGDLKCEGKVDFSTAINPIELQLKGVNNFINTFLAGTQSNIHYNAPYDFAIMPLIYYNLEIDNIGIKTLTADLIVNGTLIIDGTFGGVQSILELGTNNAVINLSSISGKLSKISLGTVSFTGLLNMPIGTSGTISFTGNPIVNMSGGILGDVRGGVNFGSGTLNVLTDQSWTITASSNVPSSLGTMTVLIASSKTLTIAPIGLNLGGWINKGLVNGVDGTSTLNINGTYGYGNTNIAMATGVFNYNNNGTSNIYVASGVNLTLPMNSFYDLTIAGTATLGANSTVSRNLNLTGTLQLSIYDFTCSGTTTYSGFFLKSGSGIVNLNTCFNAGLGSISFTGNPIVNLSGDFTGDVRGGINFGANQVNIIQSLALGVWVGGNIAPSWNASFLIASGKTFKNIGMNATLGGLTTSGTITGVDATSIFDNRSIITYNNVNAPMTTGKLYCNQSMNTFIYGLTGNQDIQVPSDSTPGYQNLTLNGSGIKKILGNISVKGVYTLSAPATLNSNGFALTNP